jgi:hypothetical protein
MKQLDSEWTPCAIIHSDDQVEGLFDEDIVSIYIIISGQEIPFDDDTITLRAWVQELDGRVVIGFLLSKQGTVTTRVVSIMMVIVMVVPIAPTQDSCEQEESHQASPPPASASHPWPSLWYSRPGLAP